MRRLGLTAALATVLALIGTAPAGGAPSLPPPAPKPTSTAVSPQAPDPSPPLGGTGPDGRALGGARLLSRGVIVPDGSTPLPAGITAASWIVVDLDNGSVLAARDPHGRYQPASILKTLTAITLLPKLKGDQVITASHDAAGAEGSAVGLVEGGRYTVDELFAGLLLESGNDTARALAEAAGGLDRTVAAMNAEARALGAYDTYAQTVSGLDGWQQLTTAYDMALILRAAVDDPRFVAYDRLPTSPLPAQDVDGRHWDAVTVWNQGYEFFGSVPGALVAKSGFTDAAQHTFLCAADRAGRRLGVVLLRGQRQPTDEWQQAATLLDWGYAQPAGTAAVGMLSGPVAADQPAADTSPATVDPATVDAAPVLGDLPRALAAPRAAPTSTSGARYGIGGWIIGAILLILAALIARRRFRR